MIVAESFARIFFRNAINVGLPIVECPGVTADAQPGDQFRVDLDAGRVENLTRGTSYEATAMPEFMRGILDAGGLMPWVKRQMAGGNGDVHVAVPANEPVQADWRMD